MYLAFGRLRRNEVMLLILSKMSVVNFICSPVGNKLRTIGFDLLLALQVLLSLSERLLVDHSSQLNEKQARLVFVSCCRRKAKPAAVECFI